MDQPAKEREFQRAIYPSNLLAQPADGSANGKHFRPDLLGLYLWISKTEGKKR